MEMQVGKNFWLKQLTVSQTAVRAGVKNEPGEKEITNLKALVKFILDPLEEKVKELGKSVIVNSAYRSPKVNKLVGGAAGSQHTKGEAVDIIVRGCTNALIITLIEQLKLPYDQLIDEFEEWVHVSFRPEGRREKLKARRVKVNGKLKTVYTKV